MPIKHAWFFWIPKTAGTSIYETLKPFGMKNLKNPSEYQQFNNQGWNTFGHVDPNYLIKNSIVSKRYYHQAFKFAFVRNPWDRLVSLYYYFKLSKEKTFYQYIIDLAKNIDPIGPYNYKGTSMASPQTHWLANKQGQLHPDLIGRYETLDKDFKTLCQKLRINRKIILPHTNRSSRALSDKLSNLLTLFGLTLKTNQRSLFQYRQYYNRKTRLIVKQIYRTDIDTFGYSF